MKYREMVEREIADWYGEHYQPLTKHEIMSALKDMEQEGATVYWSCVQANIR